MKPGGQRQVKAPMVLTQKNWQLCCLEEHSSTSAAQRVPGGSGQGPPGLRASQGRHPGDGSRPHAVGACEMPLGGTGTEPPGAWVGREGCHLCRSCRSPPAGSLGGRRTGSCPRCFCRGRDMAWGPGCTRPHLEGTQHSEGSVRHSWGAQGLGSPPPPC